MPRKLLTLLVMLSFTLIGFSADKAPLTIAEKSYYKSTSTSSEVIEFLKTLESKTDIMKLDILTSTLEGRTVPLVYISKPLIATPEQAEKDPRPVVYIQANIHAGEVAGKEALLKLMREICIEDKTNLAEKLILVIVPNLNPDGNDLISKENRSYIPGPENGVGIRYTSQNLDPNRDFIKLETNEIRGTVEKIYTKWNPLVTFDMHTTNGSFHKHYMTYLSGKAPYTSKPVSDYTWNKFFPSVAAAVKDKDGLLTLPYGNFKNHLKTDEGWIAFPDTPRFCSSYVSFRGRFSSLMEAYAHIDYKTRIKASYDFLLRSLEFITEHHEDMEKAAEKEIQLAKSLPSLPPEKRPPLILESNTVQNGTIEINTYEVVRKKEKYVYPRYTPDLSKEKKVVVPFLYEFVPKLTRSTAAAYILPAGTGKVVEHLRTHGVTVTRLKDHKKINYKEFILSSLRTDKRPDQGHWRTRVNGEWKEASGSIPAGSYVVVLNQPIYRLISVLLEPDSTDSLVSWNYFDSWLVTQWGGRLLPYPVLRLDTLKEITIADLEPLQ